MVKFSYCLLKFAGILEFVPSEPLSNIIAVYNGNLLSYLAAISANPSLASLTHTFDVIEGRSSASEAFEAESPSVKVSASVLENYVRSCGTKQLCFFDI